MAKAKYKIPLGWGVVSGGLFDLKQRYEVFYLGREKNLSDKISVEITLERENEANRYARRSIRFSTCSELKNFILDCIKALAVFERKRKIVRADNMQLIAGARVKEFGEAYMKGLNKEVVVNRQKKLGEGSEEKV